MRLGSRGTIYPTLSLLRLDPETPSATHTWGVFRFLRKPVFLQTPPNAMGLPTHQVIMKPAASEEKIDLVLSVVTFPPSLS